MESLFLQLSIIAITGLLFGRFAKKLKLPSVTGYLVGGLLIGPYLLGFISEGAVENLNFLSDLALAFIAFTIGSEFKISYFKQVGITPIVIAICEATLATVMVTIALLFIGMDFSTSILLGAIAAATAPAATVMVIKQYRAKGPVTKTLLSVVAIDDAVALILFGFAVAITRSLTAENTSLVLSILEPFREIGVSVLVGLGLGLLLSYCMKFFNSRANKFTLAITAILTTAAAAELFHGSALLMIMSMSAAFTNIYYDSEPVYEAVERATPPILMMFFVVSGAHLDLGVLPSIGLVGLVYILFRVIGKISGAYLGATAMKTNQNVRKYLGPALVPQAGVAIGLSFIAQQAVPSHGDMIRAVILCATLVYELIGPSIAKKTLEKAGEIETSKA